MVSSNDIVLRVEGLRVRNSKRDVLQQAGSTGTLENTATRDEISCYVVYQNQLVVIVCCPEVGWQVRVGTKGWG